MRQAPRRGCACSHGRAFFSSGSICLEASARLQHAITRLLGNVVYDRAARLLFVFSSRCGDGDGSWAVLRIFSGLPRADAVLWFELASDPPMIRLGAWFVAFALIAPAAVPGAPPTDPKSCAGGRIGVVGTLSAQFEARSRATVILDARIITTITGCVERREGDRRDRWHCINSTSAMQYHPCPAADSEGQAQRLSAEELRNARNTLRQASATGAEDRLVSLKTPGAPPRTIAATF
ncbi:hypothetical protein LPU83_2567 [Rhizobium favelukesii]|uniref:Uncharacterized protein n=1 Tax=Rhizobium favelukesii TaxID=348824 RepID=W6RVA1_9HYPH|nr:hypothetical protein LPU83_2567 [Rhizobium favelukesii]